VPLHGALEIGSSDVNEIPTAFVPSGGGSLGAVRVGVLAEVLTAGERPDLILGAKFHQEAEKDV